MNSYLIAGIVLTIIALILNGIGTYKEYKKNELYQTTVTSAIKERRVLDRPNIYILTNKGDLVTLKNTGNYPAKKVRLVTKSINGSSELAGFVAMSVQREAPPNTEFQLHLNPFSFLDTIRYLPDSVELTALKQEADRFHALYESGDALTFTFNIEYEFEGETVVSSDYIMFTNKSRPFTVAKLNS